MTTWPRPGVHLRPDGVAEVGVLSEVDVGVVTADGRVTPLTGRLGDLRHGPVEGLAVGDRYCLRAAGAVLVDPWAREVTADLPWCVVAAAPPAPRPGPDRPWREQVVMELQVRAFTATHPAVPVADRGTWRGLAHPAVIAHLVDLGVTAVEVLPCWAWETEPRLQRLGLTNVWGYNPVAWLAPEPSLGSPADVAAAVDALHAAGLAVIADVVLNHTSEGPDDDPVVRHWRVLAPGAYLRGPDGVLDNRTGCGNTVDLSHPVAQRCAMDALRHWAVELGFDGFRFDLAAVVEPLVSLMAQDAVLSQRWLIAEPWDAAGGRGHFPPPWAQWSDAVRDGLRGWWLHGSVEGRRLMGRALTTSVAEVGFVACHDGFTLADLTSYERKHNLANGEDDRDGSDHNLSANAGVEGPTDDPVVLAVRHAWQRGLLASLLLGPAVPMLSMGDELGFSQQGNNNGYCQPFTVEWSQPVHVDWIGTLTALRRELRLWRTEPAGPAEAVWLRPDGSPMAEHDWSSPGPLLVRIDDRVTIGLNPGPGVEVDLGPDWHQVLGEGLAERGVAVWVRSP